MFAYEKEPWKNKIDVIDWKKATEEATKRAQGELSRALYYRCKRKV